MSAAAFAGEHSDRSLQLADALLDRLERVETAFRLGVVGDRHDDAAVLRLRDCDPDPLRRAPAHRLDDELAHDRVHGDLGRLRRAVRRRRSRGRHECRASRSSGRLGLATRGTKPWSRSTTGSSTKDRSRSSRIVARCRVSADWMMSHASSVSPSAIRVQCAVEHERDPRELLHGAVVQKSASRRRSSCSAAIRRSSASAVLHPCRAP